VTPERMILATLLRRDGSMPGKIISGVELLQRFYSRLDLPVPNSSLLGCGKGQESKSFTLRRKRK